MNRIVLIGNGFDLAHGLPTKYRDFMYRYWEKVKAIGHFPQNELTERLHQWFNNWLDIENEYYTILKRCLNAGDESNYRIKSLNNEFCQVKDLLEKYLTEVCQKEVTKIDSIEQAFEQMIFPEDVALSKRELYFKSISREVAEFEAGPPIEEELMEITMIPLMTKEKALQEFILQNIHAKRYEDYIRPRQTLFLNFNYTRTAEKLYVQEGDKIVINIHGQLNDKENPIIFGYGDELDDDYRKIEQTNDNDFLENIKSIHYHNTSHYRRLLEFLQDEPYQVFVMGHSCGNSDRTLLNTLFEHENCISIQPFYHRWKDKETGLWKDNYTDLVKNISRNFNDKQNLRDIVVNKEFCTPLVPEEEEG